LQPEHDEQRGETDQPGWVLRPGPGVEADGRQADGGADSDRGQDHAGLTQVLARDQGGEGDHERIEQGRERRTGSDLKRH